MKILILGGSGMIGHQLIKYLSEKFETMTTLRDSHERYNKFGLFNKKNSFFKIDLNNFDIVENVILNFKPKVVINAAGVTKQKIKFNQNYINLNTNLPRKLSQICEENNTRLIQLSTDCVFSGDKGFYNEMDKIDAIDEYGLSKAKGEIINKRHVLTIRKSTIGAEIYKPHGLFEWFMGQSGSIYGYKNAIFSGITTIELSKILEKIIIKHQDLNGLFHISGPKISKYELLKKIRVIAGKTDVNILMDENFKCDRSLDGSKFSNEINYTPPSWDKMLSEIIN